MKSVTWSYGAMLLLLVMLTAGCRKNLIFDDNEQCLSYIHVHFYSKTPCQTDSSYLGKVSNLTLLAFDAQKRLQYISQQENVDMNRDFSVVVPIKQAGKFTFIAWTGLDDDFIVEKLRVGESTQQDLMAHIRENKGVLSDLTGKQVYAGMSQTPVEMADPKEVGTFSKDSYVNLLERTYRIKVITTFETEHKKVVLQRNNIGVELKSPHKGFTPDGKFILGSVGSSSSILRYPGQFDYIRENEFSYTFTTLGIFSGNILTVEYLQDGKRLFMADVLDDILQKRPEINLACTHDLEIKILFKQKPELSFYTASIWLNSWLIHSYKIDLDVE